MRVAILGCGAMGTVLGAYMTKNGCNVELIDSYEAHVQALNEKGAHIVGTVDFTVPVKAITPGQMEGIYDVGFLFTKQTANDEVLPNLLPHLGPDSTVCTLQNGVPEPFVAAHVGKARTVGGTVLWGATFQVPGVSELTQDLSRNDHLFEIGEMDGTITPRIRQVADVLGYMGPTAVTDSLMASRWGKLINNACMSGMSAACGTTFGGVLDCLPVLWVLPFASRILKLRISQRSTRTIMGVIVVLIAAGVIVALLDAEMAGILQRYYADFSFMLLAAAVLLVFIVNENLVPGSTMAQLLTKVLLVLVAVSVFYSALICFVPETGWYSDVYSWAYSSFFETVLFWT